MSKRQTLTTPISGRPGSCDRAQPPARRASEPRTRAADRRGSTAPAARRSRRSARSARRSPGSNSTAKSRSPARNADERDAEQRVGRIGLAADRPRRAALHRQPVAMRVRPGRRSAGRAWPWCRCGRRARASTSKKPAVSANQTVSRPRVRSTDAHTPMLSASSRTATGACVDIRAAPPQPHGARVARRRSPCRRRSALRQQQRVAVEPVGAALGLGQVEAVRHERPWSQGRTRAAPPHRCRRATG